MKKEKKEREGADIWVLLKELRDGVEGRERGNRGKGREEKRKEEKRSKEKRRDKKRREREN